MKKKNIQKGVLKQKLGLTPNEIKLGCKFENLLLNAQWCKRRFIATPISQIATNKKIAFVVNKNAHGE